MTVENERALLNRIAQDLEFLDRDEGMTESEYRRFCNRIPKHLRERFSQLQSSFEHVDKDGNGRLDYAEIEQLTDALLRQNTLRRSVTTTPKKAQGELGPIALP